MFGNLFAAGGIASGAEVYRLDRHPVMNRHPVTPMGESDLVRHLALQTDRSIDLIDFRHLNLSDGVCSVTCYQKNSSVSLGRC